MLSKWLIFEVSQWEFLRLSARKFSNFILKVMCLYCVIRWVLTKKPWHLHKCQAMVPNADTSWETVNYLCHLFLFCSFCRFQDCRSGCNERSIMASSTSKHAWLICLISTHTLPSSYQDSKYLLKFYLLAL